MSIPVILIHKSDHICLKSSLKAAKQYNKEVFFITDINSDKYDHLAKRIDIHQFSSSRMVAFAAIYEHMSSNSYEFEYICIERWMILLEFMNRNNIEEVVYIDSDVVVYDCIGDIIRKYFNENDFCVYTASQTYQSMIWASSGHTLYCKKSSLEIFCDYIIDLYTNNKQELYQKWEWHRENNKPGGINDMTLLYLFQRNTHLKVGNLYNILDGSITFDSHMSAGADEYEMEDSLLLKKKIKKVTFKNDLAYCYNLKEQKQIRFITLHFQSDAKRIMHLYVKGKKTITEMFSDGSITGKLFYSNLKQDIRKLIFR